MRLDIYQVDAFATKLFEGNPAAVCPLEEWLSDAQMQQIAMENNLSETAFFVENENGFHLRWFTPTTEVDLCGHATLATSHVIFEHFNYPQKEIHFDCRSGELVVQKEQDRLVMNFPAAKLEEADVPDFLEEAVGVPCQELYRDTDYLYVVENEQQVHNLNPDIRLLAKADVRGIIVTASGEEVDFVSRFFAPNAGVDEDPVTGSAHTMLTPYWSKRLEKNELIARQVSQRGGTVYCQQMGDRVQLAGEACTYMQGEIQL
ncbi:PhzF family phenazine biosynthesis protein [Fodinibius halophilus]|uniref:PhzF family phenazine biosynthesis protein n=1 Tax=Fodinibius halophilus TaxID=1736908 RepID=A0A6M1TH44_9BACT|nr:PhzF family phenazine biosynthesis protein [Fodinibius halophilus]NGP89432.1 PhzF family phenazine biosynthesis protein [Fodinibius halophilus]